MSGAPPSPVFVSGLSPLALSSYPVSAITCTSFWVLISFSVTSKNTGLWVSMVGLVLSAAKVEGAMPMS